VKLVVKKVDAMANMKVDDLVALLVVMLDLKLVVLRVFSKVLM